MSYCWQSSCDPPAFVSTPRTPHSMLRYCTPFTFLPPLLRSEKTIKIIILLLPFLVCQTKRDTSSLTRELPWKTHRERKKKKKKRGKEFCMRWEDTHIRMGSGQTVINTATGEKVVRPFISPFPPPSPNTTERINTANRQTTTKTTHTKKKRYDFSSERRKCRCINSGVKAGPNIREKRQDCVIAPQPHLFRRGRSITKAQLTLRCQRQRHRRRFSSRPHPLLHEETIRLLVTSAALRSVHARVQHTAAGRPGLEDKSIHSGKAMHQQLLRKAWMTLRKTFLHTIPFLTVHFR
ncbi:hypothetical protein MOQ_000345 [Trypanosoma cruzi marinkellei]|uniref:Uncharacterized protein n=1 Tax=Trypanosoma cruzi marinkellei TaxID=85056 RepID=K2MW00_TRYCR|nr:hypothetical protein MOQ_000345 [Trypanosoma cruzi marinkellei]